MEVSTTVRTSDGPKKVSDIKIGDRLYDELGMPVLCISVSDPFLAPLKKVEYGAFGSIGTQSFSCAESSTLRVVVDGWTNHFDHEKSKKRGGGEYKVVFLVHCESTQEELQMLRFGDLATALHAVFLHDVGPNAAIDDLSAWLEEILDLQLNFGGLSNTFDFQSLATFRTSTSHIWPSWRGSADRNDSGMDVDMDKYDSGDEIDHIPSGLMELDKLITAAYEKLGYDSLELGDEADNRIQRLTRRLLPLIEKIQNGPARDDQMSEEEIDGLRDAVNRLDHAAAIASQQTDDSEYFPKLSQLTETYSSSQDTAEILIETDVLTSIQQVGSHAGKSCDCGAVRQSARSFHSRDDAEFVLEILNGPHHHLFAPNLASSGDVFEIPVSSWASICTSLRIRNYLKLARGIHPETHNTAMSGHALPVDPYWLGFWLGDGNKGFQKITTSDIDEVRAYMQKMVDDLNRSPERPPGSRALHLHIIKRKSVGDYMPSINTTCGVDVWDISITSDPMSISTRWNPVRDGLKELGILFDKSGGIPDVYMKASVDARLAVIAGLIDSDGSYNANNNQLRFAQYTDEHEKIVRDMAKLVESVGIHRSAIHEVVKFDSESNRRNPGWEVHLSGEGMVRLNPFLLFERKRVPTDRKYRCTEFKGIRKVSDAGSGMCRSIRVIGGNIQLENGVVVKGSTI